MYTVLTRTDEHEFNTMASAIEFMNITDEEVVILKIKAVK